MGKEPMTVTEMARMGGLSRAKAHKKAELRAWGKRGGRPRKLDRQALSLLRKLLVRGKNQAECAQALDVSVRTIGRALANKPGR